MGCCLHHEINGYDGATCANGAGEGDLMTYFATKTERKVRPAKFKDSRTVQDVGRYITKRLRRENLERIGLSIIFQYGSPPYTSGPIAKELERCGFTATDRWIDVRMRFRYIACYAVTGANEGHYVHVDLQCETADSNGRWLKPQSRQQPNKMVTVFTGKTFGGRAEAFKIALLVAELLDA